MSLSRFQNVVRVVDQARQDDREPIDQKRVNKLQAWRYFVEILRYSVHGAALVLVLVIVLLILYWVLIGVGFASKAVFVN